MRKLTCKDLKLTYLLSWYKYMKNIFKSDTFGFDYFYYFPSARYEISSYLAERWSLS